MYIHEKYKMYMYFHFLEVMFCKICESNIGQLIQTASPPSPPQESAISTNFSQNCAFCLGLLYDEALMDQIAENVAQVFSAENFDGANFLLAMNMPITQALRELIVEKLSDSKWAPASMSPKDLLSRCLLAKIAKRTNLRPSLNSDLILTVSLESDEFREGDFDFVLQNFPGEFISDNKRKRRANAHGNSGENNGGGNTNVEELLTKQKIRSIRSQMSIAVAKKYKMLPTTKRCTFSVAFERDPVFIAGRYCKFSRNLPQSPWGPDSDGLAGESVAEKVSGILVKHFAATSSRFTASGREDIDVRMLGAGRPFVVQLLNAHRTASLAGDSVEMVRQQLGELAQQINISRDIRVNWLSQVDAKQAQILNIGQEEKRKTYSALCYSKVPLSGSQLERLSAICPVELSQKTVIRVLKRRPLLDRARSIHWMAPFQLDPFHFMLRLQTQAGTYVKEFVHGDFGRTRPSLAELMGLELGDVDILQLDVLEVDLEWPPPSTTIADGQNAALS